MKYRQRGGTRHRIVLWFPSAWNPAVELQLISTQTRVQMQDSILQLYPGAKVWSWSAPEDYVPMEEVCQSAS
jgi:hypothetical protein